MKKTMMLMLTYIFLGIGLVAAQTRNVTGVVTNAEDGLPIVGASVLVKGTSIGTITDIDGKFSLSNVPVSAKVLQVSFVGMRTQELPLSSKVEVKLHSDTELLDEVTVVAYGTAKKNALTGSVTTIKSDNIEKVPVTSFEKALQGVSPGIQIQSLSSQPGSQTQVRIRGVGSMSASSSPLYVIDGVPINTDNISRVASDDYGTSSNPLANLNPNDIESVTLLKDASAASLYGSRAANGVILITTKQGSSGKAKVSFKAQFSSSSLPSGGYNLMSGSEHYKLYYKGFYDSAIANGKSGEEAVALANKNTQDMYGRNPYNMENPLDANGNLVSDAKLMIDTDWMGEIFRKGFAQEYDLSVSGGNEKTKYFVSLGYLNQDGIVLASDYKRYSARVNVSSELRPWVTLGANSTLNMSDQNTPVGGGGGASPLTNALYLPNLVPVYDLNEQFQIVNNAAGEPVYNFVNPIFQDMNAVFLAGKDKYNTLQYHALFNPYIDFDIYGVHWKTSLSYDFTNLDETRWYNPEHGNGKAAQGRLNRYSIWNTTLGLTSTLNYNFTLADNHHFSVLAGYELYDNKLKHLAAEGTKFPPFGLVELAVAATPQSVDSYTDSERMVSYFGRLNYDFNEKYFASFSLRSDGSSRFAPGHRFGTFYSLGLNWRINQENFMKNIKWIDDLKLRASYGTSGNKQSNYLYGYMSFYKGGSNYNGQNGFSHDQIANSDLSWEKAKNFNLAVDFGLFNRLTGSIDFYKKSSDALLLSKPLAGSVGLESIISNLGGMSNTGIEFDIHSANIRTDKFTWNTDFNISWNENKITSYPKEQEIVGTKIRQVGYSIYEFYMQEWAGVNSENGAPQWYKDELGSDGKPTGKRIVTSKYSEATKYKLGSALPVVYGGLNNTLTYANFDFSFLFSYGFGGKVYDGYEAYLLNDGNKAAYQAIVEQADYWTPTNKTAPNPKFVPNSTNNANSTSSRYLHRADFIKFKNVSLGYTLPKSLSSKLQISNLRVFASLDNVCIWNLDKTFKGYDVELGGISGVLDGAGTIPLPRTILFGINVGL